MLERDQQAGVGSTGLQHEKGDIQKQEAASECKVGAYLIIIERVNLLIKIIFREVGTGPARATRLEFELCYCWVN